jgi:hypothetical protein
MATRMASPRPAKGTNPTSGPSFPSTPVSPRIMVLWFYLTVAALASHYYTTARSCHNAVEACHTLHHTARACKSVFYQTNNNSPYVGTLFSVSIDLRPCLGSSIAVPAKDWLALLPSLAVQSQKAIPASVPGQVVLLLSVPCQAASPTIIIPNIVKSLYIILPSICE